MKTHSPSAAACIDCSLQPGFQADQSLHPVRLDAVSLYRRLFSVRSAGPGRALDVGSLIVGCERETERERKRLGGREGESLALYTHEVLRTGRSGLSSAT